MSDVQWKRILDGPKQTGPVAGRLATVAFLAGGLLLVWSSYIHFHLWDSEGYRHIATIGPLFLLQSIAGLVLGVLVIVVRRVWAAVLAAGFALSTMAGFLISVEVGLFGFKDSWEAPFAHDAFFVELTAAIVLIAGGALCAAGSESVPTARVTPTGVSSTHD
jgi:hypothetical protein